MKILLRILLIVLILFGIYDLVLVVSTFFVDMNQVYMKNSRFYRLLLYSGLELIMFFGRVKIHYEGLEKLPKDGKFLLVSNHRSNFDPMVSMLILRKYNIAYISKPENFKIPLAGKIVYRCCFMPIDRVNTRNALETLERAVAYIKSGEGPIGAYPEGTRSKTGELLKFRNGLFKVAQKADVPIVVMTVKGTERICKNFPWRRTDVYLKFTDVIPEQYVVSHRTFEIGEIVRNSMEASLSDGQHKDYLLMPS